MESDEMKIKRLENENKKLRDGIEGISRLARNTAMCSERFQLNAIGDQADSLLKIVQSA